MPISTTNTPNRSHISVDRSQIKIYAFVFVCRRYNCVIGYRKMCDERLRPLLASCARPMAGARVRLCVAADSISLWTSSMQQFKGDIVQLHTNRICCRCCRCSDCPPLVFVLHVHEQEFGMRRHAHLLWFTNSGRMFALCESEQIIWNDDEDENRPTNRPTDRSIDRCSSTHEYMEIIIQ